MPVELIRSGNDLAPLHALRRHLDLNRRLDELLCDGAKAWWISRSTVRIHFLNVTSSCAMTVVASRYDPFVMAIRVVRLLSCELEGSTDGHRSGGDRRPQGLADQQKELPGCVRLLDATPFPHILRARFPAHAAHAVVRKTHGDHVIPSSPEFLPCPRFTFNHASSGES